MRKTYGNTWWGKQWLNALKNIDHSSRLPRGRTFANQQKVQRIRITKNGLAKVKVKGKSVRFYEVEIALEPFTEKQKQVILQQILNNPLYLSQLLNRQLPASLLNYCKSKRIKVFPTSWDSLGLDCGCSNLIIPCKHMSAALYIMANEIDKDPFLVFQLRGLNIIEALKAKNVNFKINKTATITKVSDFWQDEPILVDEDIEISTILEQIDFSIIPYSGDNLFALLSSRPPFFIKGDFKKVLQKAYQNISKKVTHFIKQETEGVPSFFLKIDEVNIFLDEKLDFKKVILRSDGRKKLSIETLENLVEWLNSIPSTQLHQCMQPIVALYSIYHFALKLLQKSAFIPQLIESLREDYGIRWIPALMQREVKTIFDQIDRLVAPDFLAFRVMKNGKIHQKTAKVEEKTITLVSVFLKYFITQYSGIKLTYDGDEVEQLFFVDFYIEFNLLDNREVPNIIQLWLNKFFLTKKTYVPLIKVEEANGNFKIELFIENRSDPTQPVISMESLFNDEQYATNRMDILQDLALLIEHFPQIKKLLTVGEAYSLLFSSKEFVKILFETLPALQLFGIRILLPKTLKKILHPRMSMRLGAKAAIENRAFTKSSILNIEDLLTFEWQIAIGEQVISKQEFLKMVRGLSGIVKIHDEYVYINDKEIEGLLQQLENPPPINGIELFKIALSENYGGAKIHLSTSAQKLMDKLVNGEPIASPKHLRATLRPYQSRGYEWLYKNAKIGFGSLIADDMGLGKTIQVISTLLKFKEEGLFETQKALAIVPTTLLTNWDKEIKKFAPTLEILIYHGARRKLTLKGNDLILTTYGIVRSETTKFAKYEWLLIILDEAQHIKNPKTAQTRAIKKLKAKTKIAMTGTPVENRLTEYWSIFDFINKGYLYGLKKFKDRYVRPIELDRDKSALNRLKKETRPFIIRRLKSDKSIIQDLPDKIEKDQYCVLSPKQAALYQNTVNNIMAQVEAKKHIERSGLILKLLTALKQICNHPAQFLKSDTIKPKESGKTERLLDLLSSIFQANEKALIFTQYRQMGHLLAQLLEQEMGLEIPFLHGGVARKQRDKMVDDFQERPYVKAMLISLKAGGTGLNLTAANHVIHYDLWWNPAVEAQATDRAYRIGQQKNVQVHRFITQRTFEEKINQMIQSKKELANLTLAVGENWIGDLSNQELRKLVKLE